jgi:SPP1 family phage portal protein
LFSPAFGDVLYPYFDETGDMIAFSREFNRKEKTDGSEGQKNVTYFETYTDTHHWLWRQKDGGFALVENYPKKNAIGKIPIVFAHQEEFETQDVDSLIDRLETLLSNFADTNDYHASPKIVVKGNLLGFAKKGESGAILQLEGEHADARYLSWQHAPESVKLEIETLLRMIYTITQTPDISFDSIKGLGAISGIALKLLFMDAHLKVLDKREIFDEYLQRRVNVIKAFIGKLNTKLANDCNALEIEPEVVPYIITSEIDEVKFWTEANAGKPLVSHKQSVKAANLSQDTEADWEQIVSETEKENFNDVFETTT